MEAHLQSSCRCSHAWVIFSSCFFLLSFFILRMHIVDNVSYPESDADFSIPVLLAALGPASRQDTPTLGWPPLSWYKLGMPMKACYCFPKPYHVAPQGCWRDDVTAGS
ncbi:hypothetical protein WJX79_004661 [Trebouxia sp. C0005]